MRFVARVVAVLAVAMVITIQWYVAQRAVGASDSRVIMIAVLGVLGTGVVGWLLFRKR
jgi:hypothetical protein